MNYLSLSKNRETTHFPILDGRLAHTLQELLETNFSSLPNDHPIRLDISRKVELLKESAFYVGDEVTTSSQPK